MNKVRRAFHFHIPTIALCLLAWGCSREPMIPPPPDTGPELEALQLSQGLLRPVRLVGDDRAPMRMRERLDHYRVPGVSIAVVDGGELRWAKSWGVTRAGSEDAVTPETLFQGSSISKALTATVALGLVEEGTLELDRELPDLLDPLPATDGTREAGKGHLTLRRLLSHTAGTGLQGFAGYEPTAAIPDRRQILRGEAPSQDPPLAVERPPGSAWVYSGGGYLLVEELLTRTLGKTFGELMEDRLFGPLDMDSSFFGVPSAEKLPRTATGHDADGEPLPGGFRVYPELAAAGVWSTPTDLAQWVIDLQKAHAGKPGRRLDRETVRAMFEPQEPGGWGLGVQLGGAGQASWMGHAGGNAGFPALALGFVSSGHGVVVATNGDGGHDLIQEIVTGLAEVYEWPAFRARTLVQVEADEAELEALAGRYVLDSLPGRDLVLERSSTDESALSATFLGRTALLVPVEGGTWTAPETTWEVIVTSRDDASSRVTGLRLETFPGYRLSASRVFEAR